MFTVEVKQQVEHNKKSVIFIRGWFINPIELRTAKTLWSFGPFECSRVKLLVNSEILIRLLHVVTVMHPEDTDGLVNNVKLKMKLFENELYI